jgi:hypothetical protein
LRDSDWLTFFEDMTKLKICKFKIPSEIIQPLKATM